MWSVLIALSVGILFASLLYLFNKKQALAPLLFAIRTIAAALLTLLLINPIIKNKSKIIEQPIIIIAQDISSSIVMTDDSLFYKHDFQHIIDSISNTLEEKYNVERYYFGDKLYDYQEPDGNDYTDINAALSSLKRMYYKQNVGAVVLLSDGIVNHGISPELTIDDYPFPIYSVTLGDTVKHPDILIKDVRYNKTANAGITSPIRLTVNAINADNARINVIVKTDGEIAFSNEIRATSNHFSKTIDLNIEVGDEGTRQIDIEVSEKTGISEANLENNRKRFFIEVIDNKSKVLCVARAPHPDIAAIKSALGDHYEFETVFGSESLPDFNGFDMVIAHDINVNTSLPTLNIIGNRFSFDILNDSQKAFKVERGAANTMLDVKARYNNGFGLFTISSDIRDELATYPPLSLPHINYVPVGKPDDLLLMNVMDIETPNPLLTFITDDDGKKSAFIFGTGCWRWKIFEYYHHKNNDGFNELFGKTAKYLLTDKDKELTLIFKEEYSNTERIVINAELLNPARELTTEPNLHLTLTNRSSKERFEYDFSKNNDRYSFNIGLLPEGIYEIAAHTVFGGIDYHAEGTFSVVSKGIEAQNLTADINKMKMLADKTGGRHLYISDISSLTKEIAKDERITSIAREETRYDDLINIKSLLIIILILTATEWLLRKIFGTY